MPRPLWSQTLIHVYAASSASRSQFPVIAPASYVLCKNSINARVGDVARFTSSYIRRYSTIPE